MSVSFGSKNTQRLLLYISLTDWFLKPRWKVFTARYGLIPYINTLRVVFNPLPANVENMASAK